MKSRKRDELGCTKEVKIQRNEKEIRNHATENNETGRERNIENRKRRLRECYNRHKNNRMT